MDKGEEKKMGGCAIFISVVAIIIFVVGIVGLLLIHC